jgi:nitrogen regulatory protein P-II 1
VIYEVKAIVRPEMLGSVLHALQAIPGVPGLMVSQVRGLGRHVSGTGAASSGAADVEMAKVETVIPDALLEQVIATIESAGRTGRHGDGKIVVTPTVDVIRIRNGDRGAAAVDHGR